MNKKVKDPHVVAGLLKLFFSSLPEPLFPFNTYSQLIEAHGLFPVSILLGLVLPFTMFAFVSCCDFVHCLVKVKRTCPFKPLLEIILFVVVWSLDKYSHEEDQSGLVEEYRAIYNSIPTNRKAIIKFLFEFLDELQTFR
tara:strand:- start:556 stop:972 length:417 start_codon:yes stop_codon:yes gene_type:complete